MYIFICINLNTQIYEVREIDLDPEDINITVRFKSQSAEWLTAVSQQNWKAMSADLFECRYSFIFRSRSAC